MDQLGEGFRVTARAAAALTVLMTASIMPLTLTGVLSADIGPDIGFGNDGLGLLGAVYFGTAAATSAGLGRLSERLGARRSLLLSALVTVLVALAIGLFVQRYWLLAVSVALAGAASAFVRPAVSLYVSRNIPAGRQGVVFGLSQSSPQLSSMAGGLLVPLTVVAGWQSAFLATAALSVLAVALLPRGDVDAPARAADAGGDLPRTFLLLVAVTVALGNAGAASLGTFLVPTMRAAGITTGTAAAVVVVSGVLGVTARLAFGYGADRRPVGLVHVAVLLGLGGFAFVLMAAGVPAVLLIGVPLACVTAWGWHGLFQLVVIRLNPAAPASAAGITQAGLFLGGVAGPFVVGQLAERFSFTAAWSAMGLLAIGAAAGLLLATRLAPAPHAA